METKQAAPTTIDEYIAQFPEEIQQKLQEMRAVIHAAAPEATEKISYQMPTFMLNGVAVHYAAFTSHLGVYPPVHGDAALMAAVAPYANEKGNLRFPFAEPIPYDLIVRIAVSHAALNLAKRKRR